jgi:hypothetical protein
VARTRAGCSSASRRALYEFGSVTRSGSHRGRVWPHRIVALVLTEEARPAPRRVASREDCEPWAATCRSSPPTAGRCAEDDQRPVRDENPQPASHRRVRDVDAGAESSAMTGDRSGRPHALVRPYSCRGVGGCGKARGSVMPRWQLPVRRRTARAFRDSR